MSIPNKDKPKLGFVNSTAKAALGENLYNFLIFCNIISYIDKKLDDIPPESWRETFGTATLGGTESNFLKNVVDETAHDAFMKVAATHGIPQEDIWEVGNVLCAQILEISDKTRIYNQNHTPENRQELLKANLRLSTVSLAFCSIRTESLAEAIRVSRREHGDSLDHIYETIKGMEVIFQKLLLNASPYDIERMAHATQAADDSLDMFIDLRNEIESGRTSPNWILAELESEGISLQGLYDKHLKGNKGGVLKKTEIDPDVLKIRQAVLDQYDDIFKEYGKLMSMVGQKPDVNEFKTEDKEKPETHIWINPKRIAKDLQRLILPYGDLNKQ